MVGLLDIVNTGREIDLDDDHKITVWGISSKRIVSLLDRFPPLRKMLAEREVKPDELMKLGPDIIAAVIAEGITERSGSDKERNKAAKENEEAAHELNMGDQLTLVTGIVEATFRRGFGPLAESLQRLGLVSSGPSKNGSGVIGRAVDTKLPAEFSSVYRSEATTSEKPGNTPPPNSNPGATSSSGSDART